MKIKIAFVLLLVLGVLFIPCRVGAQISQTSLAKEKKERITRDKALLDSINKERKLIFDSITKTYYNQSEIDSKLFNKADSTHAHDERYYTELEINTKLSTKINTSDNRLTDSRIPKGSAAGDLIGNYPKPTIKSSVVLTGSPAIGSTPRFGDNSKKIANTQYVDRGIKELGAIISEDYLPLGALDDYYNKIEVDNKLIYKASSTHSHDERYFTESEITTKLSTKVNTSDSRLTDSRIPKGTAAGDLTGNYPNPTIKSSVTLKGNPTVEGGATIKGNLRLKGSGNFGNKLNFGDGEYAYIHEDKDDELTIKAKKIKTQGSLETSTGIPYLKARVWVVKRGNTIHKSPAVESVKYISAGNANIFLINLNITLNSNTFIPVLTAIQAGVTISAPSPTFFLGTGTSNLSSFSIRSESSSFSLVLLEY